MNQSKAIPSWKPGHPSGKSGAASRSVEKCRRNLIPTPCSNGQSMPARLPGTKAVSWMFSCVKGFGFRNLLLDSVHEDMVIHAIELAVSGKSNKAVVRSHRYPSALSRSLTISRSLAVMGS